MSEPVEVEKPRTLSESSDVDYDPHFAPIITLPEVEVSTNEENEEVMLKLRAKLYRFDTKTDETPEWKERGTGEVKLLKQKDNHTVRVVMRRDKTLKVCANHFITPYMELKPSIGSDKAFIYTVIGDFADEQIKSECLAIRFGNVDFASQFKEKFNEAKKYVLENCTLYNDTLDSSGEARETEESDVEEERETAEIEAKEDLSEQLSELTVKEK